jgi:hypothetical protein
MASNKKTRVARKLAEKIANRVTKIVNKISKPKPEPVVAKPVKAERSPSVRNLKAAAPAPAPAPEPAKAPAARPHPRKLQGWPSHLGSGHKRT